MSTQVITGLYEFDPYGTNPNNRITNERQVLQTPGRDDYQFIIPRAAPFFVKSLIVRDDATGEELQEGRDYAIGHYFIEAMHGTGRPIAGSIRFLRRDITGIVNLEYQTLGGQWGFDDAAILEELSNRLVNPLRRAWAQIAPLPATFPPLPHDQKVDTIVGIEDLIASLAEMADAIYNAAQGVNEGHIADKNNPHNVNKEQVGLGNVENFSIATAQEARELSAPNKYITPQNLGAALDYFYQERVLGLFTGDGGLPFELTKEQVGLGNLEDYPIASEAQAIAGDSAEAYMTPYHTSLTIDAKVGDAFRDHVLQRNPHGTRAEDIGAISVDVVEQMLEDYQRIGMPAEDANRVFGLDQSALTEAILSGTAADSERLIGMTYDELREDLYGNAVQLITVELTSATINQYIRLCQRPVGDGPSQPISLLLVTPGTDGVPTVVKISLRQPSEAVSAVALEENLPGLEFYSTYDGQSQELWVRNSLGSGRLSIIPLTYVDLDETLFDDDDEQTVVTSLSNPQSVSFYQPLANLVDELTQAFTQAATLVAS